MAALVKWNHKLRELMDMEHWLTVARDLAMLPNIGPVADFQEPVTKIDFFCMRF